MSGLPIITAGLSGLLLMLPMAVHAADDETGTNDLSLEEILAIKVASVASLFKESALSVPSTIEVLEEEDWQRTSSRTLWEAIEHLPNTYMNMSTAGTEALHFRGLAISPGTRGTAMIIDGVPMNEPIHGTGIYAVANTNPGVLERIEMIRGPGSTIYGADAFQSVLSLQTKTWTEDVTETSVSAGGKELAFAGLNVARTFGALTFGVSADYREFEEDITTWFDNRQPYDSLTSGVHSGRMTLPGNPYKVTTVSPKLIYRPDKKLRVELAFLYNDASHASVRSMESIDPATNPPDYEHIYRWPSTNVASSNYRIGRLGTSYFLTDQLELEARLFKWIEQYSWDFRDRPWEPEGGTVFFMDFETSRSGYDLRLKQHADKSGIRLQWLFAVSGSQSRIDKARQGFKPDLDVRGDDGLDRKVSSAYGEAKISPAGGRFEISAGVRLDQYSDLEEGVTSPRAGFIYHPTPDQAIKLLYGNAFRAPSLTESCDCEVSGRDDTMADMVPETIDTWELVWMKSNPSWFLELVLFQTNLTDGIIQKEIREATEDDPVGHRAYVNESESEARGVEVKLGFREGKWDGNINISRATGRNTHSDYDYDHFPTWMGNFILGYDFGHGLKSTVATRIMLDRATTQVTSKDATISRSPDYYRVNARVSKDLGDAGDISLDVRNLFNEDKLVVGIMSPNETWVTEGPTSAWLTWRYRL